MPYSKEQKRAAFSKLPNDVREAMVSFDNAQKVQFTAKKYGVVGDKVAIVAQEIGDYTLGFTPYGQVAMNIKEKLGIPVDIAQNITNEVITQVYGQVKISLQKFLDTQKMASLQDKNQSTAQKPTNFNKPELESPHDMELTQKAFSTTLRTPLTITPLPIKPSEPKPPQPPAPTFKPIRTLESDILKEKQDEATEKKAKIVNIPRETVDRGVPQINQSTGNYAKDPYREQI